MNDGSFSTFKAKAATSEPFVFPNGSRPPFIAGRRRRFTDGILFRCVNRTSAVRAHGIREEVIWCVVKEFALKANLGALAPHHLRRTCARL